MGKESKLGLGGHSFIEELGNDPQASFDEQCAIVAACFDNGITLIDTTYYQERVALGHVLKRLGRRDEARIMAWNFFKQPGRENELVGYTPYEPQHLDRMLEELQTDAIDLLVIHAHDDAVKLGEELALAQDWVQAGKVKQVALGMAQLGHCGSCRPIIRCPPCWRRTMRSIRKQRRCSRPRDRWEWTRSPCRRSSGAGSWMRSARTRTPLPQFCCAGSPPSR